jgi:hypothetical protein
MSSYMNIFKIRVNAPGPFGCDERSECSRVQAMAIRRKRLVRGSDGRSHSKEWECVFRKSKCIEG